VPTHPVLVFEVDDWLPRLNRLAEITLITIKNIEINYDIS
jgi:hypothetical protein